MDIKGFVSRKLAHQLQDSRHSHAMRQAFHSVRARQADNLKRISDMEGRKQRLRQVREEAVGNVALLEQAVTNLKRNGFQVYHAATSQEALALIVQELGQEKLVVKSKSNVTKEIGLTEALVSQGIEVVETDIGDRIVQLAREKPSHPTAPASHLSRYEIARVLSAHSGNKAEPIPEVLAGLVRDEVDGFIQQARIGITGANAIAAEEGSVLLWHNEGNIWEVMMRPGKHLILAGREKIYPNLDEAINLARVQAFYATGQVAPTFINVIGGPSQTADIENRLVRGVHGPQEVCLILVDNYRSEVENSDFRELLYCIGCGACLLECPAYAVYGHKFSLGSEQGGKGVVRFTLSHREEAPPEILDLCLKCRRCQRICPLSIDIPHMIDMLQQAPALAKAWQFVDSHGQWLGAAIQLETVFLMASVLGIKEPPS